MSTTNNFSISVILPIKSASPAFFDDYLKKAIESIKTQERKVDELIIVHCDDLNLIELLKGYDFDSINVKLLPWTKEPNFSNQVNYGVESATSEWISIFEFDDEYSKIWFKNVENFSKHYKDVDCFLPIVVDVDEKGLFVGFTNEATFALNVTTEMGYLTNDTLHQFQNFQLSGLAIKKSVFMDYGKLKTNFKLTFGYEFFLRMTHNSVKVMSIPRIGYKHTNLRTGSIFWNYKNSENTLTENEVKFWIESAKKEYFFTNERQINYEPEVQ
jgi:glycosyltransferase involved in cell wall biosynthesis